MIPIKTYKKIKTILLYFVIKKNVEISFRNGPEHETTSLSKCAKEKRIKNLFSFASLVLKYNESGIVYGQLYLTRTAMRVQEISRNRLFKLIRASNDR